MKFQKKIIVLICFLITCSFFCARSQGYFTGKSRGETIKNYIRYGSFDIWNEFKISEKYQFVIEDKENNRFFTIEIEPININNDKVNEVIEQELESVKRTFKYLKEKEKRDLNIDNRSCKLITFDYNEFDKSESNFEKLLIEAEICYIDLDEKLLKIKGYGYKESFKNGKQIWENFYKSFKSDQSQEYKTNLGSFIPIHGMKDYSRIAYTLKNSDYFIEIQYINDKQSMKKKLSEGLEDAKRIMTKIKISVDKEFTIEIGNIKAFYREYKITNELKNIEKMMQLVILDDLDPGLEIVAISEKEETFEFYRGEMELFLRSLKFDK